MSLISVFLNLVLWLNGSLCCCVTLTHSTEKYSESSPSNSGFLFLFYKINHYLLMSKTKNQKQNTIRSLFLLFIGMLYLNNMTISQNSANTVSQQTDSSLQTSFFPNNFMSYIQPGSFHDTHTIRYRTHCTHPPSWTLKARTRTPFIFNTSHKCAELKTAVTFDVSMLDSRLSAANSVEQAAAASSQTKGFLYMACDAL